MRINISIILVLCFCTLIQCQTETTTHKLLIGTYTSSATSDGIYVYDFNSRTGDANLISKVSGEENPSYLAVSRDGKHVFAVNEVRDGTISAFLFNPTSGELTFLNRVSSGGANPINEQRQAGPHVHCVVLSPDNQFLLTANLGTDKVSIYQFDASGISQPLTPAEPAFISVSAGSGPRHLTFHPNAKYAYIIAELTGEVVAFDYNNGKLSEKQTITMLSPDFSGRIGAADIHVSPDGNFLYGSNRGDANEIVIYSVSKSGELNYIGHQPTQGQRPRNFVIDPTGSFLLVANQDSDEIIIFRRDMKTGLLTDTEKRIQLNRPVCLKFSNPG